MVADAVAAAGGGIMFHYTERLSHVGLHASLPLPENLREHQRRVTKGRLVSCNSNVTAATISPSSSSKQSRRAPSVGVATPAYNSLRPHSSLDGITPDQAYFTQLPLGGLHDWQRVLRP